MPHYRKAFDAKGVRPEDLKQLSDLAKFPFTVKSDLHDNYPFGLFAVPSEKVARIHASSGTTGKPTVVGYTKNDIDTWADLVARSIRAAGGRTETAVPEWWLERGRHNDGNGFLGFWEAMVRVELRADPTLLDGPR